LFLYNKSSDKNRIKFIISLIVSSVIVLFIINLLLTSFWLMNTMGRAYLVLLSTRFVAQVIMLSIQIVVIFFLEKALRPVALRYLYDEDNT